MLAGCAKITPPSMWIWICGYVDMDKIGFIHIHTDEIPAVCVKIVAFTDLYMDNILSISTSPRSSPVVSSWIWIKAARSASVARHFYASTSFLVPLLLACKKASYQRKSFSYRLRLYPILVTVLVFCFHRSKLWRKVSSERVPKTCVWRQPVTVERNLTQVFRKDNWAWCKEWRYDCTMIGPKCVFNFEEDFPWSSLIVERWRAEHRHQLQCHAYERSEVPNIRKLSCGDIHLS